MDIKGTLPDINEYPPVEHSDFHTLSHQDLIQECLKKSPLAWEEFFRRFIPLIKKTIFDKLNTYYAKDPSQHTEISLKIYHSIVIKLCKEGILNQCTNYSDIGAWLKTIAENQTIDWLRAQGRQKRFPEQQIEMGMESLFAPLQANRDITIGDTIACDPQENDNVRRYLEKTLESIGDIADEKKMWVFRLALISQLPLSKEEIEKLAQFSGHTVEHVESRLSAEMDRVGAKEEKKNSALFKAIRLWHEIRCLEAKLYDRFYRPDEQETEELSREIREKTEEREECLQQGLKISKPSNRQIAELVGLREDQVNQISNILTRVREALWEAQTKNIE